MKTRRRWLILAGAAGVSVVALWAALGSRESVYQGKPVSYWLDFGAEALQPVAGLPRDDLPKGPNKLVQAREALGAIGPRALPYLAARMGGPTPAPIRWYRALLVRLPAGIRAHLPQSRPKNGLTLITGGFFFAAIMERAGTNAIPELLALSGSNNSQTRRLALLHLGRVAADDHRQTLPVFDRALRDVDFGVRFDAFRQVCQMAGTDPKVGPILIAYLNEAGTNLSQELRLEALAASGGGGPQTNPVAARAFRLLLAVAGTNVWEQAFAAFAEWQQIPTSKTKDRVFAAFQSAFDTGRDDSQISLGRAFENLHLTGQQEHEMLIPLLAKGLAATNVGMRMISAGMLSQLGVAAELAQPALITSLEDPTPGVRAGAIQTLGHLGRKAPPAVPSLIRHLKEDPREGMLVWNIAFALGKIGPGAREAVPSLMQAAKETGGDDRSWLLGAAVAIDPQNKELVPALLSVLRPNAASVVDPRESSRERCYAARLLGEIGPTATEALLQLRKTMLEDNYLEPRLEAMEAILKIAPREGAELVPVMIEALSWGESDSYRTPAIVARLLGQIGPKASPKVIPELVKLLDDKEVLARLAAAQALAKVAPDRKAESVGTLYKLMAGKYGLRFRLRTIEGLWSIAPDDPQVIPELIKLLMPNNELPGDEPLELLRKIGPTARAAGPQLRAMLEDQDWRIRRAARELLERIENPTDGQIRSSL